eukprot:6213638-Pleurochrysis_carterae.AAC.2
MSSLVPRALQLFISGAFRSADVKPTAKALTKLASDITKAAEKGDGATANSKLKDFLTIAKIEKELDTVDGGNFNPKQRRNAGAPPTAEVEAQVRAHELACTFAVLLMRDSNNGRRHQTFRPIKSGNERPELAPPLTTFTDELLRQIRPYASSLDMESLFPMS